VEQPAVANQGWMDRSTLPSRGPMHPTALGDFRSNFHCWKCSRLSRLNCSVSLVREVARRETVASRHAGSGKPRDPLPPEAFGPPPPCPGRRGFFVRVEREAWDVGGGPDFGTVAIVLDTPTPLGNSTKLKETLLGMAGQCPAQLPGVHNPLWHGPARSPTSPTVLPV
jgi:hypothetical protein